MSAALSYSLKVWLTSLVIGTTAFWSTMFIFSPAKDVEWSTVPIYLALTMFVAILISLPALIAFFLASYMLKYTGLNAVGFKTAISLISIATCFITFYFIAQSDHHSVFKKGNFILLLCYSLPIPVCVWFYKIAKQPN